MSTRKRGAKLLSTDEQTIERNARARAVANGSHETVAPVRDGPPPPGPDPSPDLPFIGSRSGGMGYSASVLDFAAQMLMADTMARMARDAGLLNAGMSEAQAKLVVLRGFEMGIPPLRALNELYLAPNDQGGQEFVEEASLMRAQVAASGLGVIEPLPEKCNAETATVRAIRHDRFGHRQGEFTYTLADATADGLLLKRNWQSGANREALLTARATAKAKRAWFEDVESPRYTADELGGGGEPASHSAPVPRPPAPPPAPPAPVAAPAAGATDAGGTAPPVASPPPGAAAVPQQPSSPPPPSEFPVRQVISDSKGQPVTADGPPPGASRQEKMAYYAAVGRAMNRPWTSNVGMSRDAQPVPIITHGVMTEQITLILNYTVKGRTDFARADEALQLVIDHLGTLGIDTSLLPPPYCFFALTQDEAVKILQGLDAFARSDVDSTAPAPEAVDSKDEVQDGQTHSWTQANDYFESVLRRVVTHATRGDVLGMMRQATGKEFYELTPDELFSAAADFDRLGKNPTILKQAIDRMRVARGG